MDTELKALTEGVLALSVPPGRATIPGGLDARGVVGASLNRCRDLLRAVVVLGPPGLERITDPLARASLELAATSGWLMKSPEEHFAVLGADLDWRLRQATAEVGEATMQAIVERLPPEARTFFSSLADAGDRRRIPCLPKRMRLAGLEHWYTTYRLLSLTTHPSLLGVFSGAHVRVGDEMVDTRGSQAFLVVIAMTLYVAELANNVFGWSRGPAIADAFVRFNAYVSASAVERTTPTLAS